MHRPSRPTPGLQRRLLLLGTVALLVVLGVVGLRARYGWRDALGALAAAAEHLSHQRVLVAFVGLGGAVWLTTRWRSVPNLAHVALLAYVVGVLGDAVILLLLEPLGISYGPVLLSLGLLVGLRSALAVGLGLTARLTARLVRPPPWRALHLAGQALILVLVLDAFAIEPMRLTTSHVPVPDPHSAQPGVRPLRIVQISDLHIERANSLSWHVVQAANDLKPDVIVLTGDYLNGSQTQDSEAQADLRRLVGELRAEHGIYAILGNMDSPTRIYTLFRGLPVELLEGDWATVEVDGRRLAIAGMRMGRDLRADRKALARLAREMPADSFSLLLYHSPDLAPEAAAAGFDLYVAGHTHGGQVRLPFYGALFTNSIYGKRYEMGLYHEGSMLLYVSRGVGMEGWLVPRVRFLCPPEIVCFDIG